MEEIPDQQTISNDITAITALNFEVRARSIDDRDTSFPEGNLSGYVEDRCPQPAMRPAIIRVFEDRMVRVTILRRDGCVSPTSSPVTARLIALSAVLASAGAFSPISMCRSSSNRLPHNYFLPSALTKPLHKGLYGGMGMKSIGDEQTLPFVTAAAAVAAVEKVILIKTLFSCHK